VGQGVGVRRTLHRRLVGLMLVAALIGAAGCSRETSPEPPEPFGDFAVGQFGGVAGLQEVLRVRADGNAVLIAREPASGRFTEEEMARLRTLLTSEQFRQEAARELEWKRKPRKIECSDQIITEVSMGSLSLSRSGPCGQEDLPDAPAFNEILTIVGPARRGDFAGPVEGSEPRLVPVRLERLTTSSRSGYVITTDGRGAGSIELDGAASRSNALTAAERDTARLLIPELISGPITLCQSTEHYRVRIEGDTPVSASDCEFRRRYPEFRALVKVMETAFGVS
jgi:hypothetical protein